jgi:hypothetical protein
MQGLLKVEDGIGTLKVKACSLGMVAPIIPALRILRQKDHESGVISQ